MNNSYLDKSSSDSIQIGNITLISIASLYEISKVNISVVESDKTANQSTEIGGIQNVTLYISAYKIIPGRLGNQMFRYASLLGIARAQGRQIIITPDCKLQQIFHLQHAVVNKIGKRWLVISERNALSFDENLTKLPLQNLKIYGYLQSYRYFDDIADDVRHEYIFRDYVTKEAGAILHDLHVKYKGTLFVGVHVRRGDFLKKRKQDMGYGTPGNSYFRKAFDWMKSKFPGRNITFLVASDDLIWCNKNLISSNVITLPTAVPAVHMAVLSSCDHVIITGGTFGWWSAWLAGGYVIYYNEFMQKGSYLGDLLVPGDYYPRQWVGLGN